MSQQLKDQRPLYRVYHLKRDGGIARAEVIEALDDECAVEHLRTLATDHSVELWDRARFVAKVEPPAAALVRRPIVVRAEQDAADITISEAAITSPIAKTVH